MQYQIPSVSRPAHHYRSTAPSVITRGDYRSLTMMDRSFDPNQFLKTAQAVFFKVQGAWNKQDTAALSALCGRELMQTWEEEVSQSRARNQQNRMENIALRESEISEVWTENGEDFITVRLHANLLDYTVDAKTGAVCHGSNSDRSSRGVLDFNRPVGPKLRSLRRCNKHSNPKLSCGASAFTSPLQSRRCAATDSFLRPKNFTSPDKTRAPTADEGLHSRRSIQRI